MSKPKEMGVAWPTPTQSTLEDIMTDFEKNILNNMVANGTTREEIMQILGAQQAGPDDTAKNQPAQNTEIKEIKEIKETSDDGMEVKKLAETVRKQGEIIKGIQNANIKNASMDTAVNEDMDTIIRNQFIEPILKSIESRRKQV